MTPREESLASQHIKRCTILIYMRSTTHKLDQSLTRTIQRLPRSWRGYFKQMTLIGQPVFGLLAAAAVAYYGEYIGDWRLMIAAVIVAATLLMASGMKFVLRRRRPLTDYAANMFFKTYSFPSGHSAASTSCYGLIIYLCLMSGHISIVLTGLILIPIVLSIGISRVYLGAHFPSDVIGGWLMGGIGLALAIWVLQL